jgi:hypothetical protein
MSNAREFLPHGISRPERSSGTSRPEGSFAQIAAESLQSGTSRPTESLQSGTSRPSEFLPSGTSRPEKTPAQVAAAAGVGFDYPATLVGVTGNITVM